MTMLLQARSVGVSRGANELFSDLEFTANSGDRIGGYPITALVPTVDLGDDCLGQGVQTA